MNRILRRTAEVAVVVASAVVLLVLATWGVRNL